MPWFFIDFILNSKGLVQPITVSRDRDACPCCVANFMDVKCQGQFNDTETTVSQTAIGRAQEDFIEGTTPVLAGLGGLLALCWILACCCCRSTLKQVRVPGTVLCSNSSLLGDGVTSNPNSVSFSPFFAFDSA